MPGSVASTGPKSSPPSSCPLSCCLQVPGGVHTPRWAGAGAHAGFPSCFRTVEVTPSRRGRRAVLRAGVHWAPGSALTWFRPWHSRPGGSAWPPVYRGGKQRFRETCGLLARPHGAPDLLPVPRIAVTFCAPLHGVQPRPPPKGQGPRDCISQGSAEKLSPEETRRFKSEETRTQIWLRQLWRPGSSPICPLETRVQGGRWGSGLRQREGIHTIPGSDEAPPHWAGLLLDSGHDLGYLSLRETPPQILGQCVQPLPASCGSVIWTHKVNCPSYKVATGTHLKRKREEHKKRDWIDYLGTKTEALC